MANGSQTASIRPKRPSQPVQSLRSRVTPGLDPALGQGDYQGNVVAPAHRLSESLYERIDAVLGRSGVANVGNRLVDQDDARTDVFK